MLLPLDLFSHQPPQDTKYISKYQDEEGLLKLNMKNVVAKQWMLNNNEFFAMVLLDGHSAKKLFIEKELK